MALCLPEIVSVQQVALKQMRGLKPNPHNNLPRKT